MVARVGSYYAVDQERSVEDFLGKLERAPLRRQADRSAADRLQNEAKPENAVAEEPAVFPALENLVYVSQQDSLGAGVMFYVAKVDGKEVVTVVDNAKTHGLYDWAAGMSNQFSEAYGSFVNNVWTVSPREINDVTDFNPDAVGGGEYTSGGKYKPATRQPDLQDIERISRVDEFPGVMRYEIKESAREEYDGDIFFYATKGEQSDIYDYLVNAAKVLIARDKAKADGFIIAGGDTIAPHFTQINGDSIKPVEGVEDTLTFETKDGDKYFVHEELSPDLYARITSFKEQEEVAAGIDAPRLGEGAIYNNHITKVELNKDGEALPDGMLLVTLKGHPTFGDGTYLVAESTNSQAYDTALSWYTNGSKVNGDTVDINGEYNDINSGGGGRTDAKEFEERFKISREDWDIMAADTNVRLDEKDDSSRFMTVGELAMKKLREKYEEEAKNDPDSKAAKFIALLDAVAAYSSGRSIQAYTQGSAVSSISGEYYVPSEDWQGVIDYEKLMAESNAMWQDPEIQEAYSGIVGDVIGGLDGPTMEERAKKLHDLIVGDPDNDDGDTLALWLADMKGQGREGEAEVVVQGIWSSLAFLDKPKEDGTQELLKSAMDEFQIQALMVDMSSQMQGGIGEDQYAEAAVQSNMNYILSLVKSAPNLLRLTPNAVNFIEGVVNGKIPTEKAAKLFSAVELLKNQGVVDFTPEQLNKILGNSYFAPGEVDGMAKLANDLNKVGMLGTVVGGISVASGVLRLTQLDTSNIRPEDVLLITRDFLSFLSFSEHYAKGMNVGVNKVAGLFKKEPSLVAYLGLNSSLPEIWGDNGRWGKTFAPPSGMWSMVADFSAQAKLAFDKWTTDSQRDGFLSWDKPESAGVASEYIEHFDNHGVFGGKPPAGLGGTVAKTVGSVIKILGNGLDAPVGIIDIVFNSLKLSKANGDAHAISSGVFGLLGGAANVAAGTVSGVNALFRTLTFASVSSPLFIVGTVFGVVAALIELFAGQRETDQKLDKQREWLASLADAGVMKEEWGTAFEFINTWYAEAKGRNDLYDPKDEIPLGLSIFDYDRGRWDRFRENWEPGELPRGEKGGEMRFFNEEELQSWWENEGEDLVFTWDFSEDHHNPGNKISPDHPAAIELKETAEELASWYSGNMNLDENRIATFGNESAKQAIEDMADFYLNHIDANADAEVIADWIMKEMEAPIRQVAGPDGDEAWDLFQKLYDKWEGKDEMMSIIDGTFTSSGGARADFENTLNSLVSFYASAEGDEDDSAAISTERRQLSGFTMDPVKPLFQDLVTFYIQEVDPKGSAEDAAKWAIDQIKERVGTAFQEQLDSDDKEVRKNAEDKLEIFMNYLNKDNRSGKSDALEVAKEVLG